MDACQFYNLTNIGIRTYDENYNRGSRLTVILSWVIALVCLVGGALFIWLMPSPGQGAIDLQAKKQKSPKSISDKIKQEQAQRELPLIILSN